MPVQIRIAMMLGYLNTSTLPCCVTRGYSPHVTHNYHFKRGDHVRIQWGRYAGLVGIVDSAVFQRIVAIPTSMPLVTRLC